jgi:hypothetical protein
MEEFDLSCETQSDTQTFDFRLRRSRFSALLNSIWAESRSIEGEADLILLFRNSGK